MPSTDMLCQSQLNFIALSLANHEDWALRRECLEIFYNFIAKICVILFLQFLTFQLDFQLRFTVRIQNGMESLASAWTLGTKHSVLVQSRDSIVL